LSRMFNPIIRGWLEYYGRYYRSALYPPMRELNQDLVLWAKRKYKSCDAITDGRHAGSRAFRGELRSCLLTGRWGCGVAPWWELYELRGSSTVLREPRGETLLGYSPQHLRSQRTRGSTSDESITRFITQKLKLKVNGTKSAVARTAGAEVSRIQLYQRSGDQAHDCAQSSGTV
jgi:hypothetical protein